MQRGFKTVAAASVIAMASMTLGAGWASAAALPMTADTTTWQADGRVDAVAYSPDGSTLYLSGIFHHLCPPTQATCKGTEAGDFAVSYLAAINAKTGVPLTSWKPTPNGEVESLAVAASGVVYAGGTFDTVSGQAHHNLVAVTAAGTAVATWKPTVNSVVKALALSPDGAFVYAGGSFGSVDGVSRSKLAALTTYSTAHPAAAVQPWAPNPVGSTTTDKGIAIATTVNGLTVRPSDGQVYATGVFTSIGGQVRNNVAALGSAAGGGVGAAVTSFSLTPSVNYVGLNVTVTPDGTTLLVNGRGPGGFVLAADSSTGNQTWYRHLDGDIQAAATSDTTLYVGGHFDNVYTAGTSTLVVRHHLAAFDTATGSIDPWDPRANSAFGVNGIARSTSHLAVSGDFTQIASKAHSAIAQFDVTNTLAPGAVRSLTATSTTKDAVKLAWTAATDADTSQLTYRIYRRPVGGAYTVIAAVAGPNAGTATGSLTYADLTATVGASYQYQVRAGDSDFLSAPGNDAGPIVVAGDQNPPTMPTGVKAVVSSAGNATVSWTATGDADDATLSYTVTRRANGVGVDVGTITGPAAGALSFHDSIRTGGTFTYTVRASDGTFTSATTPASAAATIAPDLTSPGIPTAVAATSPTPNSVTVTWTASADADQSASLIRYVVYRKVTGDIAAPVVIGQTPAGQTTFTESTDGTAAPLPDLSYTYSVASTDGPNASAQSLGAAVTVRSSVFTDDFASLASWTLPSTASGVTKDTTRGHSATPSARLVGKVTPASHGYATRSLGAGYRTVCAREWVSITAFDLSSTGKTSLLRLFSTTGADLGRLYVDHTGVLWVRSDWGSNPQPTTAVLKADGSWHSVQLCLTTTAFATDGTMSGYFDGLKVGSWTGVDNAADPIGSIEMGESEARNFTMNIDDISVGTTPR